MQAVAKKVWVVVLAALALAACSGGAASKKGGGIAAAYPPGPYGNNVGDTLPNVSWQGYVNDQADALSTTKPFVPYTMDNLRKSGRPLALLHLSEYF